MKSRKLLASLFGVVLLVSACAEVSDSGLGEPSYRSPILSEDLLQKKIQFDLATSMKPLFDEMALSLSEKVKSEMGLEELPEIGCGISTSIPTFEKLDLKEISLFDEKVDSKQLDEQFNSKVVDGKINVYEYDTNIKDAKRVIFNTRLHCHGINEFQSLGLVSDQFEVIAYLKSIDAKELQGLQLAKMSSNEVEKAILDQKENIKTFKVAKSVTIEVLDLVLPLEMLTLNGKSKTSGLRKDGEPVDAFGENCEIANKKMASLDAMKTAEKLAAEKSEEIMLAKQVSDQCTDEEAEFFKMEARIKAEKLAIDKYVRELNGFEFEAGNLIDALTFRNRVMNIADIVQIEKFETSKELKTSVYKKQRASVLRTRFK